MSLVGLFSRRLHRLRTKGNLRNELRKDFIVRTVSENIRANYSDPSLNVNNLARQVGLSPNYLITYFHKHTGYTPYQFLLSTRIERARELLTAKDRSVTWVAEEVGFTSPYHFSATFKSMIGVSPSEFRGQLKAMGHLSSLHA